ncbi:MAG: DNA polymerase III subunit gamma/tau [Candidatus Berkelbacteria bacterium]|nr:DNA polymerase III subunit gamma/tau [Candidatus Berkelbacteria bacterium]
MATLYRKYRPQLFKDIIGQDHIVKTLQKALENDRLAHAYLFCGPRGVGKTTIARILAKAANCLDAKNRPCGKCKNCLAIAQGKFIDLIEIDAASNRGIDEIRDLRDKIQFAPNIGKYRVYIIDEVHMLTREAFNALLKTLEEPPAHTIFIFATTEIHKVPETVISRCQRFDFHLGKSALVEKSIKQIAKSEKFKLSDDVLRLIVKASGGSYRDAQSLLDQLSPYLAKGEITLAEALKILNLAALEQLIEFIDILKSNDQKKAISYLQNLRERGVDFAEFVNMLIAKVREELIEKIQAGDDLSWHQITLHRLIAAALESKSSPIDTLPLELAVLDICEGEGGEDIKQESKPQQDAPSKISEIPKDDLAEDKKIESKLDFKEEKKEPAKTDQKKLTQISADQRKAIIETIATKNKTFGSLLETTEWILEGDRLVILAGFNFHKDKIMEKKNYSTLKSEVENAMNCEVDLICKIKGKEDIAEDIGSVFF